MTNEMPIANPNLPANHQDAGDPIEGEVVSTRSFGKQSPPPIISKTPVVEQPRGMNFHEALDAMMIGKTVTRLEWANPKWFGAFRDAKLMIHKPEGTWVDWIISDGDIMGNDWTVL